MAIKLIQTTKIRDDCYSVTVQDTGDQIGIDEDSNPIYRTYTLKHNPVNGDASLKTRFEGLISAKKKLDSDESTVTTAIKTAVEAIDTEKITAKE